MQPCNQTLELIKMRKTWDTTPFCCKSENACGTHYATQDFDTYNFKYPRNMLSKAWLSTV